MAKCRECKQTSRHKMSCSRTKGGGSIYVTSVDEIASNFDVGTAGYDSGSSSCYDSGSSSSSYDSGSSSSCSSGE